MYCGKDFFVICFSKNFLMCNEVFYKMFLKCLLVIVLCLVLILKLFDIFGFKEK